MDLLDTSSGTTDEISKKPHRLRTSPSTSSAAIETFNPLRVRFKIIILFSTLLSLQDVDSLRELVLSRQISARFINEGRETRGTVGLQNCGNTCFMNAAIQALSNCPPIRNYFCALLNDTPAFSDAVRTPTEIMLEFNVSTAFRCLMGRLWCETRVSPIRPTLFCHVSCFHLIFYYYCSSKIHAESCFCF